MVESASTHSVESQHRDEVVVLDRVSATTRILFAVGVCAVAVAILLNWLAYRDARDEAQGIVGEGSRSEVSGVSGTRDSKGRSGPPLSYLTPRVLGYETLGHQIVPGSGGRAAEAIFKTLDMEKETQRPTTVYARVERFSGAVRARAVGDELAAPYVRERASIDLPGARGAVAGFLPDKTAYLVTWRRGDYLYAVKGSFAAIPPAWDRERLEAVTVPVARTVAYYRDTGSFFTPAQAVKR